jgi:hypothetical protein
MRSRLRKGVLGVVLVVGGLLSIAGPAAADSMTVIPSFTDPRTDMPARSGTLARGLYGPYTVPANSEVHNAINTNALVPCNNCYITDMVANLVDSSTGATVNLAQDIMLHHFVLINRDNSDVVCPGGLQGGLGERFFAAGNERSHLHLPSPYGYYNTNASTNWWMIYHLVNKGAVSKSVNIEIIYRYRTDGIAATPLWFDIDGCGDSEYTAPNGASDTHVNWTSDRSGRFIGIAGHLHDVDITTLSRCLNNIDDDGDGNTFINDGCPAVGAAEAGANCSNSTDNDGDGRINDGCPVNGTAEGADACVDHCPAKGHGVAVSAEIVSGSSNTYYGPIPPNRTPPADLTGATLCRSEGYYGTTWAGTSARGHLDTMSLCGVQNELPAGHQAEAYPPDGAFPIDGVPISTGQVVKLHSEYQNDTGAPQTDVMGIMMAWMAPSTPGYARPKGATPLNVRLVPAYAQCSGSSPAGMKHGAPLAQPSCSPPVQTSNYLTIGSPDANGFAANSTGYVVFRVVGETPINFNNGDQADVQVTGQITDVRRKANPSQLYTGQIQLSVPVRITDKYNVGDQATVQDLPFNITATCTNGVCNFATSFDSALASVIKEGKRAVWDFGQVQVFDGGADDNVSTAGNTLFETQGYFEP